ncbi:hypothetical protein LO763_19835 [Glycomyces sp. A-F 0318]|uniref:hypothetical protein n=1 Tax=Glycomyces amatae TaxID=2881355 RepID=UPI001E367D21|nr:hypothetical protein [Glycomyces amatae]MCD0445864.1 hypothetical protein [Glycomyces amatae]
MWPRRCDTVAVPRPAALLLACRAVQEVARQLDGVLPVDAETAMCAGRSSSWESAVLGNLIWASKVKVSGATVPDIMIQVLFDWVTGGPTRAGRYIELAEGLADIWRPRSTRSGSAISTLHRLRTSASPTPAT